MEREREKKKKKKRRRKKCLKNQIIIPGVPAAIVVSTLTTCVVGVLVVGALVVGAMDTGPVGRWAMVVFAGAMVLPSGSDLIPRARSFMHCSS